MGIKTNLTPYAIDKAIVVFLVGNYTVCHIMKL